VAPSELAQVRLPVPWLDPLEAHLRLRAAGRPGFLLLSAGAHPEARWSFVALDEAVEVRIRGRDVEERWSDGAIEALEADPLAYLDGMARRFRRRVEEPAPFTGGWVGWLGFALAQAVEPTLPEPKRFPGLPDAVLRLARTVVAFDHAAGAATLYAADLDGDLEAARDRAQACAAALARPAPPPEQPLPAQDWSPSLGEAGFVQAVREAQRLIAHGDHFQSNLATCWSAPWRGDPAALLGRLRAANPGAYMALLECGDHAVVSGSPEQLFAAEGGRIRARPIAGTRKRGATPEQDAAMAHELATDPKEQAEHLMLVDLLRNDLARVARPGTVSVPELGSIERYRHVMHLVSRVEAQLRPEAGFGDWLRALFPGGTVTGAPKVRATQRILELEPAPRGPYTGAAGYLSWSHRAHWSILIRGILLHDGQAHVHAGSGIVAGADPAREWREAQRKARAMLEAATGALGGHADARVLLVDNYDSFVHNLADYLAALGAEVRTVRNDADLDAELERFGPTHAVLSPGPGWPDEAGCTLDAARRLHGVIPLLGVCLGHQALAQAHGGRVHVHPAGPVHGRADAVHHEGAGLLEGLPSPLPATRYHSLAVDGLGPEWRTDARLADGTVMAIAHRMHPTFGLQFHPESVGTPHGMAILERFLVQRAAIRNPFVRTPGSKPRSQQVPR
jgi:anthranilate synthase